MLSMTSPRGRFAAGSCSIVTGPDIIWKVQPVMDPMLAPANTALALEVVELLAEHTVFVAELSVVGNGGFH